MDMISEHTKGIMQQWTDAAELVARHSQDPVAKAVSDYIKAYIVPAFIDSLGYVKLWLPHGKKLSDTIGFLPLFEVDGERSPEIANFLNMCDIVGYFENYGSMFVRAYAKYSDVWRGVLMLHMGYAALWNKSHPINHREEWTQQKDLVRGIQRARDTHNFQNGLVSALGGEGYTWIIDQGIAHLKRQVEANPGESFENCLSRLTYPMEFDLHPVFGPAVSRFEVIARSAQYQLHCAFQYLEETVTENPQAAQCKMLDDFREEMNKRTKTHHEVGRRPI
ncbi:MAG: hypothetical protein K0S38_12 [Candidatus Paceibacter sp.]|jgi:hypothetical protein|nr:hypothetical protein [Candidatus Paceibacter sp.]